MKTRVTNTVDRLGRVVAVIDGSGERTVGRAEDGMALAETNENGLLAGSAVL
jgi:hypothetical protein